MITGLNSLNTQGFAVGQASRVGVGLVEYLMWMSLEGWEGIKGFGGLTL